MRNQRQWTNLMRAAYEANPELIGKKQALRNQTLYIVILLYQQLVQKQVHLKQKMVVRTRLAVQ